MEDGVLHGVKTLDCLGEVKDNTVLLFILIALSFLDPRREAENAETTYLPDHFRRYPQRTKRKKDRYIIGSLSLFYSAFTGWTGWYK